MDLDVDDVFLRTCLIDDQIRAEAAVNSLLTMSPYRYGIGGRFVAIKLEGIGIGSAAGQTTMVKVASYSRDEYGRSIFLFDVEQCPLIWSELMRLLSADNIVKVFHDCFNDLFAIQHQQGLEIESVYDTAIADYVIRRQTDTDTDTGCRPLPHLVRSYGTGTNYWTVADDLLRHKKLGRKFLKQRPLPMHLMPYAVSDVHIMWQVYLRMRSQVRVGADLMAEMLWETKHVHFDPQLISELRQQRELDRIGHPDSELRRIFYAQPVPDMDQD